VRVAGAQLNECGSKQNRPAVGAGVPGETDLLLRNNNTGGLEIYNINNNQLTGAAFLGTVGLEW
jgi:hypothetical protein